MLDYTSARSRFSPAHKLLASFRIRKGRAPAPFRSTRFLSRNDVMRLSLDFAVVASHETHQILRAALRRGVFCGHGRSVECDRPHSPADGSSDRRGQPDGRSCHGQSGTASLRSGDVRGNRRRRQRARPGVQHAIVRRLSSAPGDRRDQPGDRVARRLDRQRPLHPSDRRRQQVRRRRTGDHRRPLVDQPGSHVLSRPRGRRRQRDVQLPQH